MSNRLLWIGGGAAVIGLGLILFTFGTAQEATRDHIPKIRQETDITFAHVGETSLQLDVAMPVGSKGPFPAVVCIHGGGWVRGDRKQMAQTIDVLARRGYVAIAPDYRLAPKHRFPACIEDCKTAVRYLRANCGRYNVDTTRIGVVGLSAGAHLACLMGVTEPGDGLDGNAGYFDHNSRVQAVVSFSGPTDLTDETLYSPEVLKENLIPLLGGTPKERPDAYRKASPMHYAPKTPPPFLLVHGSGDRAVPVQQVQALADKLKRCGGKATVRVLPGEGHTWNGDNLKLSIDQMLTFLDETLKQ